jgi:RNA polymerase sigma-70 factor (ECF subfamily)
MSPAPGTTGSGQVFPTTRWTVIRQAADPSASDCREALEALAATYWRPVYAHFRRKWGRSAEEAGDLTQDFFAALCEKEFLGRLSPDHGRFRSYVMAALDNFARLGHRARSRRKRGGGAVRVPIQDIEPFEPARDEPPERAFLKEWARSVLSEALEEMEREYRAGGLAAAFELFAFRDVRPPEGADLRYEALGPRFGMSVTDVTNALYRARKKLRELVLRRVRDTVTSDEEAESEMRELFEGREPR